MLKSKSQYSRNAWHQTRTLFKITKEGELLRNNQDLFLSQRAIVSFGNYASAQLARLKNALAHGFVQQEKEEHILEALERSIDI